METPRSPFPGMDPYLERPTLWQDFHDRLITYLCDDVQAALPSPYYARIQERVYLEEADRWIVPDVRVSELPQAERRETAPAAVAVASGTTEAVVVTVPMVEVREPFIEIRDSRTGDRVVTVIEVLSPENKRPGAEGADLYRNKQREVLRSDANLVEIDLLRGGKHVVAVPRSLLETHRPYHYLVVVRRGARPSKREVYPIRLANRLPKVRVPLREPDPDVAADLQALVECAYRGGAYGKTVDYVATPDPPFTVADQAWATSVLSQVRAGGPAEAS